MAKTKEYSREGGPTPAQSAGKARMGEAEESRPASRLQDSPKFATMNFRSVSSVTARLTPSLPIPLILTPPNGALSHRRFVLSLMSTAPAFTFLASLIPRAEFEVKIEACSR